MFHLGIYISISKINLTLVIKKGGPLRIGKRSFAEEFGEKKLWNLQEKESIFPSSLLEKKAHHEKILCVKMSSEVDLKVVTYTIASFKMLSVSNKYFR